MSRLASVSALVQIDQPPPYESLTTLEGRKTLDETETAHHQADHS